MAKPGKPVTAPAPERKVNRAEPPSERACLNAVLAAYRELHPQDDAGRVVLDRLAADPDKRVSRAIAAIGWGHSEALFRAIIVAVERASKLKIVPDRFSAALKQLEKTTAALSEIQKFPDEFGLFPGIHRGFGDPNGDHAQFLLDVRTVIPRMAKHLEDLRETEVQIFARLRISRKRRTETFRELAALQKLIETVRGLTNKPHERACAALIEAALAIGEIPDERVRYAARKARMNGCVRG